MSASMSSSLAASAGLATKSFWATIQSMFTNLVLGCIFCSDYHRTTAAGFAYYFPEGLGYLYVAHLGSGNQGAALLVRSVADQQNYVRKRKKFPSHRFPASNEAEFAFAHKNIPRCILQTPYRGLDADGKSSSTTADIWTFCNGGNMQRILNMAREKNCPVPSVLTWRLLRQLLPVVVLLHTKDISHRDIKGDNIFLHWKEGASLPDFFLGDFGIACRRSDEARGSANTFDCMSLLAVVKLCVNPAATFLGAVAAPDGVEKASLDALLRVFEKIESALFFCSQTGDEQAFLRAVRNLEKELSDETAAWEKDLEGTDLKEHKMAAEGDLQVFVTKEALLGVRWPPGPWKVAAVEQKAGVWRVKQVLSEQYCENEADFT